MVHTQVYYKYIHFSLLYKTDHILTILPIKHLVNQYSEPTTPQNMKTITKPSVSNQSFYSVHVFYERNLHILTQRR